MRSGTRLALSWAASCWVATLCAADTQDLQHCRAIADADERLACYDAVAANASPASASPASASSSTVPAPAAVTESAAADSFGQESLPRKSAAGDSKAPQEFQSRVASVRTDALGKLVLGLDNGQTWTQTDSPSLKLGPGDQILIRRGVLGSYLLARVGSGAEIRVRRSQ